MIFKEDLEAIFGKRPFDKEDLPLLKSEEKTATALDEKKETNTEEKKEKVIKTEAEGEPEKPLNTLF